MTNVTLDAFQDKFLDGLDFCALVYGLFEQIKVEKDGLKKIRLRTKEAKKLVDELLPICRFIQIYYGVGKRFQIKWQDAPDAVLDLTGDWLDFANHPRKIYLEVTTSAHPKDYLAREQLHEDGMTFGPRNIAKDNKTGKITSTPVAYQNDERSKLLVEQIHKAINEKSVYQYPKNTILIVDCTPSGLILPNEWEGTFELLKARKLIFNFRSVFLFIPNDLLPKVLYSA